MDATVRRLARRMAGGSRLGGALWATRRLGRMALLGNVGAARELAEAVARDDNTQVAEVATELLAGLRDQRCIDEVCRVWDRKSSSTALDRLLAEQHWVFSRPSEEQVRTALQADRADLLVDGDGMTARDLLEIATGGSRPALQERAAAALRALRRPDAREEVCTAAIEGHEVALSAVNTGSYLPVDTKRRALLLLLAGRHDEYAELDFDGGDWIAKTLLKKAEHDRNPMQRERAAAALRALRGPIAREAVCAAAIADNATALSAVSEAGYLPADAGLRALLLFLTGRHDEYAELDFDGQLLRAAYQAADTSLRSRLTAVARTSGRVEWVHAVIGPDTADGLAALPDSMWETVHTVLVRSQRWDELWRLALEASPARAVQLLTEIPDGWMPSAGPGEQAECVELVRLAKECAAAFVDRVLWVQSAPRRPSFSQPQVRILVVTPDGRVLVAENTDGDIELWRLPSGERIVGSDRTAVLAACSFSVPTFWRSPGLRRLRDLSDWFESTNDLVDTPDGTLVAGVRRSVVTVWRLPDKDKVATIEGVGGPVAIAPDGALLVGVDHARSKVGLWRLPSGQRIGTVSGDAAPPRGRTDRIQRLLITPDGKLLATAGQDCIIKLWRLPSGAAAGVLHPIAGPDHGWGTRDEVSALATTPDSRLLIAGNDSGLLQLWRLPSGEPVCWLDSRCGAITDIVPSPDGGLVAVGGTSGTVQLFLPWIVGLADVPAGQISFADVDRLRSRLGACAAERPWIELISKLVGRRYRYDIGLADDRDDGAAATDIEIG